jgi:hypothetical protein
MGGENTIIILSKRTKSIHKTLCRKTIIGVPMFLKKNTSFKSKQGSVWSISNPVVFALLFSITKKNFNLRSTGRIQIVNGNLQAHAGTLTILLIII